MKVLLLVLLLPSAGLADEGQATQAFPLTTAWNIPLAVVPDSTPQGALSAACEKTEPFIRIESRISVSASLITSGDD